VVVVAAMTVTLEVFVLQATAVVRQAVVAAEAVILTSARLRSALL